MNKKFPITTEGYKRLGEEIHELKFVQRPAIAKAIDEARSFGDLSENAEYKAAREEQGFLEAKIADLEGKFAMAEVIDVSKLSGNKIQFGATVTLVDEETEEELRYKIVSEYEADLAQKLLSIDSPIARALINNNVGDSVEVNTPRGVKYYEVMDVEYV